MSLAPDSSLESGGQHNAWLAHASLIGKSLSVGLLTAQTDAP